MKNATVEKKSGQRTFRNPSNDERVIIFRWSRNPIARTRATRTPFRDRMEGGREAGSPSAISRDRLLRHERDVCVLERRFTRRHSAERDSV
jgi:hypothetical protein